MEKEIGPNVYLQSSRLCSFGNSFQEFLFVSRVSQAALELAIFPKVPDFPVSLSQMLGDRYNSHRALFLASNLLTSPGP